jgi:hypothetical protein
MGSIPPGKVGKPIGIDIEGPEQGDAFGGFINEVGP